MKKCPRCHIKQDEIVEECQYCGLNFNELETDDKSKKKNYNSIIIISVLIALSLIFFLNFSSKFQQNQIPQLNSNEKSNKSEFMDMAKNLTKDQNLNLIIDSYLPKSNNTSSIYEFIASIIFGIIGMIYFGYGKKKNEFAIMISGILLMVYPYIIDNLIIGIITGVFLTFLPLIINLLKN
ncbi:MAG: hypothetical protein HQK79_11950 [Desulfobacterales bacterium]|nr:hypothetical protein [Desulfobacterales bacterium]MBF0395597.1 hypothetical protein [Desulfobacterales bacterium]